MKPYYERDGITIYHGDCREILPTIHADVLVTDPPYNVGKDYGTSKDDMSPSEYWSMVMMIASIQTESQAWIVPVMPNHTARLMSILPEAIPIIIRRGAQGPKRWGWFDQYDMVLVRGRPSRYVSNLWDGIRLKGEGYFFREDDFGHPGYTPYPIMARLVDLLVPPGGCVVDPFVGTGTTLRAAKDLGRRAIGIEIEERYCEIAVKRLQQSVLPLEIPA